MEKKFVIINRAVPSSGKSTISKIISEGLAKMGYTMKIHSTDEYFMFNGKYIFDIAKLNENHAKNLNAFEESLKLGEVFVNCDNINMLPWQTKPYTDLARKYNYTIIFMNYEPRDIEEHIKGQTVSPERPDAHGVPRDCLERFIEEFYLYDDLLDKSKPINPELHFDYKWSNEENKPIKAGVALHFDLDYLINIAPDNFEGTKKTILARFLNAATPFAKS